MWVVAVFWVIAHDGTAYQGLAVAKPADLLAEESIPVEFHVDPPRYYHGDRTSPKAKAEVEKNQIVLTGRLKAPDPCRKVHSTASKQGTNLTLRITTESNVRDGYTCVLAFAEFDYRALIKDITPGTYHLRVIYEHLDTYAGWPIETVLKLEIDVQ